MSLTFNDWIQAIIGLATIISVLLAVLLYRQSRIDGQGEQFRRDIISLLNRFDELMACFQDNIVATCKKIFDIGNPETKLLFDSLLGVLGATSEQEFKEKFESVEMRIDEWVLYSLEENDLARARNPRIQCYATLQSVRGFLPIMFQFIGSVGEVIFDIYNRELHIMSMRNYVKKTLRTLWRNKQSGTDIKDATDLQFYWRSIVALQMSSTPKGSYVDIFNDAKDVIRLYAELYLKNDDRQLWKTHKAELKTDLSQFEVKTRTEKMTKIAIWKVGKKNPQVLTQIVQAIAKFESKLEEE